MNDLIYKRASDVLRAGEPIDKNGNGRRGGEEDWHDAFAGGDADGGIDERPKAAAAQPDPFAINDPEPFSVTEFRGPGIAQFLSGSQSTA